MSNSQDGFRLGWNGGLFVYGTRLNGRWHYQPLCLSIRACGETHRQQIRNGLSKLVRHLRSKGNRLDIRTYRFASGSTKPERTFTDPDTIGTDLFGRELRRPITGTQGHLMDTRDEWSARRQGETASEHRSRLIDAKQPSTMF